MDSSPPSVVRQKPQKSATVLHSKGRQLGLEWVSRFPKIQEIVHFHYQVNTIGSIRLSISAGERYALHADNVIRFSVEIWSRSRYYVVQRSYEDFRLLDKHLHECSVNRTSTDLQPLPKLNSENVEAGASELLLTLDNYLQIVGPLLRDIRCSAVLHWFELDSGGEQLLAIVDESLNINAISCAIAVKQHIAQASDELTLELNDLVSIIHRPCPSESRWWRGKKLNKVGFFPMDCVELIDKENADSVASGVSPTRDLKPVMKKQNGKNISSLGRSSVNRRLTSTSVIIPRFDEHVKVDGTRSVSAAGSMFGRRPSRDQLKREHKLCEATFGCDLAEHIVNKHQDIPMLLRWATEMIETHGIADGIYRHSGGASNVNKLRVPFDQGDTPDILKNGLYLRDIHAVSSLVKMYFRELPNPLLTHELYHEFIDVVDVADHVSRLAQIQKLLLRLPPPHYRTACYLFQHLSRMASHHMRTGMHAKNLAIVWAPNLIRSEVLEYTADSLYEVSQQAKLIEEIIVNSATLFTSHSGGFGPKLLFSPEVMRRLLPVEEAQPMKAKSRDTSTPVTVIGSEPSQSSRGSEPSQPSPCSKPSQLSLANRSPRSMSISGHDENTHTLRAHARPVFVTTSDQPSGASMVQASATTCLLRQQASPLTASSPDLRRRVVIGPAASPRLRPGSFHSSLVSCDTGGDDGAGEEPRPNVRMMRSFFENRTTVET